MEYKQYDSLISKKSERKDNSMTTGYVVMALFGFFGLLFKGIEGAILGAVLGFGVTAIVLGAQEYADKS